jgi:hypothetical protein
MNKSDTSSQASAFHSLLPADQQAGTPVLLRHVSSPTNHVQLAVQILSEHDLVLPEPDQLNLIVKSVLAVQDLYFDSCLHRPDKAELNEVFEMFLLACVTTIPETESL